MNLFVDDLEEVINTSKTRTDGARAQLETWDESASTAYQERLRKNLQYIIEHKERWTIMRHVRSRLSHLARLACHLLACCDACAQTESATPFEPLVLKASRSRQSQRLEQRSRMVTMLQILRMLTMPTRLMGTLMMISDFVSVCGVA